MSRRLKGFAALVAADLIAKALAAAVVMGAAAQTAKAATTNYYWKGVSANTEASPADMYSTAAWTNASGKAISKFDDTNSDLNLLSGTPLFLTNSWKYAAGNNLAGRINFENGDYTVLGPIKYFYLSSKRAGHSSVTSDGDMWVAQAMEPCTVAGSSMSLTNKSGLFKVATGSQKGYSIHAPMVGGADFEMVVEGGEVQFNKSGSIGYYGTGSLVVNGGLVRYLSSGNATFGHFGTGSLVMNGGTLKVEGGYVYLGREVGSSGSIVLNGGVLETKHIDCGGDGGSILFNGGTLKANAGFYNTSEGGLVRVFGGKNRILVGEGGGTIDTGGFAITNLVALKTAVEGERDGGMTFKGGGSYRYGYSTQFYTGSPYNGGTRIELGTELCIANNYGHSKTEILSGGVMVTMPEGGVAPGAYSVMSLEGDNVFADEELASFSLAGSAPEGTVLALSGDKSAVLCLVPGAGSCIWTGAAGDGLFSSAGNWFGGAVPSSGGETIEFPFGGAVTNDLATCSPGAIVFPKGLVGGLEINGNDFTSVTTVTNLSAQTSPVINAAVRFSDSIWVVQKANYLNQDASHVVFSGGAYAGNGVIASSTIGSKIVYGRYFGSDNGSMTATISNGTTRTSIADNSSLWTAACGDTKELYIGRGSVFAVGTITLSAPTRLCLMNLGEFIVSNEVVTSGSQGKDQIHYCIDYNGTKDTSNVFKIEKITHTSSGEVYFSFGRRIGGSQTLTATKNTFYIGAGGLNLSGDKSLFNIGEDVEGDAQTLRPWHSDFAIERINGSNDRDVFMRRSVTFCTDDENDVGRTIFLNARPRFIGTSPTLTVSGSGTLKVNSVDSNTVEPDIIVTNTATLSISPGARLVKGSGSITIHDGATLAVPSNGTTTVSCALSMKEGSALAFNFTDKANAPNLAVSSVTANGTVNVKISVADGVRPKGGTYTLTSGGGFKAEGVTVSLAAGAPDWAKDGLSVNDDGNIVLRVKPVGLMLLVK